MLILICIVGGVVYLCCPFLLQLILMAINLSVPDPIPFLDEAIMVGGILSKMIWLGRLSDFIDDVKFFFSKRSGKLILFFAVTALVATLGIYFNMPKG